MQAHKVQHKYLLILVPDPSSSCDDSLMYLIRSLREILNFILFALTSHINQQSTTAMIILVAICMFEEAYLFMYNM